MAELRIVEQSAGTGRSAIAARRLLQWPVPVLPGNVQLPCGLLWLLPGVLLRELLT